MPPTKSKTSTKNHSPKHRWTAQDRTILAVLDKFYDISKDETATIINAILRDRLVEEEFGNGLSANAIVAQLNELKRTRRGENCQKILSMSVSDARAAFRKQRDEIEDAAQKLGVMLKIRLHSNEPDKTSLLKRGVFAYRDEWSSDSDSSDLATSQLVTPVLSTNKRRKTNENETRVQMNLDFDTEKRRNVFRRESTVQTIFTTSSTSSSSSDSASRGSWDSLANSDEEDEVPGLDQNDFAATATRITPLLMLRFNNDGRAAEQRPRLLFRSFEPEHGLRARAFQSPHAAIPPPPDEGGVEFKVLARRHLTEDKTHASPFLSFTQNPTRALDRHLLKSSNRCSLAIIDYNVLEEDLRNRYGRGAGPWLVPALCDEFGFDDLKKVDDGARGVGNAQRGYKGIGEWLLWGAVSCEPIAVLEHKHALQLYTAMRSISDVSYESGVALSPHLNGIHDIYKAVLVRKFLHDFQIPGWDKGRHHFEFKEFVRGVYGEPPELETSLAAPAPQKQIVNEENWVNVVEDIPQASFSKKEIETSDSVQSARKVRITVEIPSKVRQSSMDAKPTPSQALSSVPESDEDIQQLLDSQLAETGSEFGVMTEPWSDCSVVSNQEPDMFSSKTQDDQRGSRNCYGVSVDEKLKAKKLVIEETTMKTEEETTKSKPTEEVAFQEHIKRKHSEPELDLFMKELLENAAILTPTSSPETPAKSTVSDWLARDGAIRPSTSGTSSQNASNNQIDKERQNQNIRHLQKSDDATAQSPSRDRSPSIVQILNDLGSKSRQSEKNTEKRELPRIGVTLASGLVKKPSSSSSSIVDLTIEDDSDEHALAGAARKVKALEAPKGTQFQIVQSRTTTTTRSHASTGTASNKQPGVRKQFAKIVRSNQVVVNAPAEEQKDDDGDDEPVLIAETTRAHHHRHIRTKTTTKASTVLIIRSRSVSETIVFGPRP